MAAVLEHAKRVDGSPEALLVPISFWTFRHNAAKEIRAALLAASVESSRLFDDSRTHEPVDFRSLRDSGITWECLRGTEIGRVQARAGHEDVATTLAYRKQAEDLSAGTLGTPFSPLPDALVAGVLAKGLAKRSHEGRILRQKTVGPLGLEPRTYGLKVRSSTD